MASVALPAVLAEASGRVPRGRVIGAGMTAHAQAGYIPVEPVLVAVLTIRGPVRA